MNTTLETNESASLKKKQFTLSLPAPWPEPVEVAALLAEIAETLAGFVVLPTHAADALAVWVLHTYLFAHRDAVAYVAVESPEKRCGKTTLVSVLAALACKPLVASNVTVGALFNAIDEAAPTLFIDEADTFLSGNSVLRGIINCGNTWRTAYVLRSRGKVLPATSGADDTEAPDSAALNGTKTIRPYSCWCPKVVAMIGTVPETIAERSIVVRMSRKLVTDKCLPLRALDGTEIVRKCVRVSTDIREQILAAETERVEGINDRAADTYEPLAVIARIAGEDWPAKIATAARTLSRSDFADNESGELLLDILACYHQFGAKRLFSSDLVSILRARGASNCSRLFAHEYLTEHTLAKTLRPYGIRPTALRIGPKVNKGYHGADFREALKRYVPETEIKAKLEELNREAELIDEARKERVEEEDTREEGFVTRVAKKVAEIQAAGENDSMLSGLSEEEA